MKNFLISLIAAALLAGCATTPKPQGDRGPEGTYAYHVPIDSSEPGTRVEVNGQSIGHTPIRLKIYGDNDGTFHNFGSYDFIVRAYPPNGQPSQTKVYHTGAMMAAEDKIPDKIFFDFHADTHSSTP